MEASFLQQAVCVRRKSRKTKHEIPPHPKKYHEIHSSPATATTSGRRATKHIPRDSPYSPASIDPGFVEIGLVQLSQSVKKHECYTHRHTQYTDRQADIHSTQTDRPRAALTISKKTRMLHTQTYTVYRLSLIHI